MFLPTQILLTEKGLGVLHMTGGQADLCRVTVPRWLRSREPCWHTQLRPLAARLELFRIC